MRKTFGFGPLLLVLIVALVFALAACERPLQEEEEAAPAKTPLVQPASDETKSPTEAPSESDELVEPDIEGTIDDSGDSELFPPDSSESTDQPEEAVEPATYVVLAGDSLFTVAQLHNVSIDDLAAANNLDVSALLSPGATLIIPVEGTEGTVVSTDGETGEEGERVHIVQAGENLYRIGLIYGFTIEELTAYNSLENPDYIDVGQEIRIPPGGNP